MIDLIKRFTILKKNGIDRTFSTDSFMVELSGLVKVGVSSFLGEETMLGRFNERRTVLGDLPGNKQRYYSF